MFALTAILAALPLLASATLQITQPTGSGWVGNTTVTVAWKWNASDPTFSIELGNPDIQSGLLAQGPIAVANNIVPNTNTLSFELPVIPPGDNYFIHFVNIGDISQVYASVDSFPISDNPKSTSVPGPSSTGTNTGTRSGSVSASRTSSGSGSSTGTPSGTPSSGSATPSSSASVPTTTAGPPTTLILSTLTSSNPSGSPSSTTTPNGAASILNGGMSGASLAALGAVVVGAFIVI